MTALVSRKPAIPQTTDRPTERGGFTMEPLVGNMWVPAWAIRPGSFRALAGVTGEMALWLLLHSRNADYWRPSYATREQLGATVGIGVRTVSRKLDALRKAALLFEVQRGLEPKSQRNRPPARWALDPMTIERWAPKVEEKLVQIAEEDGQGSGWLRWAQCELAKFRNRSERLAALIREDLPIRKTPRKRNKSKRRKGLRPRGS